MSDPNMSTDPKVNASYRTIYIDLNGVLDTYDGWTGRFQKYPMRAGARDFLAQLKIEGWRIILFTATDPVLAREFVDENGLTPFISEITKTKGPGVIYLDDCGLKFDGDFKMALDQIRSFRVHWAHDEVTA